MALLYITLGWIVIRMAMLVIPGIKNGVRRIWKLASPKMVKTGNTSLFDHHFIEPRSFYLAEFGTVPCVHFIGRIDAGKAYSLVSEQNYGEIEAVYQHNYYNWEMERIEFDKTLFRLRNKVMIMLGGDWAEVFFSPGDYELANDILHAFKRHKATRKELDNEINIISFSNGELVLKTLKIKPAVIDIDLYYNDDFKPVDRTITERLAKENDKGIVLLHGLPGTGKTTYLRHLIASIDKKVMFVSPGVAGNLMNPDFMDLLIDNPNAVLVIEDAENIIMDRKYSSHSSVSNLLNLSDGLLSDCLNVQIVCTFNNALSYVDSALLRKGRLIAKYEFGKLQPGKAKALSEHLGFHQQVSRPMTLAEIANPNEMDFLPANAEVIGFRQKVPEL